METEKTLRKHEKAISELQKAVDELDERTARIGEEVREARLHAKEAHVGYVETSIELKYLRQNFDNLTKQMRSHTRWLVGVFISIIGLIITLIKILG